MTPAEELAAATTPAERGAWIVGALSAGLCVLAAMFAPPQFFPTYLVAWLFWLGISLGCLAVNLLHHLTGGQWGVPLRRILESAAAPLPLLAAMFLPIAYGLQTLYIWARPEVVAHDVILERKSGYLNATGFFLRAAVYFAVWIVWTLALNAATMNPDAEVQRRRQRSLALAAGPGLVLWVLAVTFSAIDWGMSLEPHWYSSMYGVLFLAGQAVSAFAFCLIVGVLLRSQLGAANPLTTSRMHDVGNFLLAFVMFWSYVSFMQYLIIWSANLPEETPWYLRRGRGGWEGVVVLLMTLHFLAPFILLLRRRTKRSGRMLFAVAVLLLAMRVVDLAWLVLPTFTPTLIGDATGRSRVFDLWPLAVTLPAIGGLWTAAFLRQLRSRALMPVHVFSEEGATT